MRKRMSKTMQQDEAASIRAALAGKPSTVSPAYQRAIELLQGQQGLPMDYPKWEPRLPRGMVPDEANK